MAKAERQKQREGSGLCSFYGGQCDGACRIPADIARLIIDYRDRGGSNLNHGTTDAFPFQAFSLMEEARRIGAEFSGVRDADSSPIMLCRGHKRWPHGAKKVKAVQAECWLPGLLEKIGMRYS